MSSVAVAYFRFFCAINRD